MANIFKLFVNDIEYDISRLISYPYSLGGTIDETFDLSKITIPMVGATIYTWDNGEIMDSSPQASPDKGDRYMTLNLPEGTYSLFTYDGFIWFEEDIPVGKYDPSTTGLYYVHPTRHELFTSLSLDTSIRISRHSRLYMEIDGISFRYIVSEDTVSETKKSTPKIFKHVITLMEVTKVLQNRPIPDNSNTQPAVTTIYAVSDSYIDFEDEDNERLGGEAWTVQDTVQVAPLYQTNETNDISIVSGSVLKVAGKPYKIAVSAIVFNGAYIDYNNFFYLNVYANGNLIGGKSWYIEDRELIQDILDKQYTYCDLDTIDYTPSVANELITYEFYQGQPSNIAGHLVITKFNTYIHAVKVDGLSKNNVDTVIDKILMIQERGDMNDTSYAPEYTLGANTRQKVNTIICPEMTFTKSTIWDSLRELGNVINAVPRLGRNDWNTIEFDFLDDFVGVDEYSYPDYTERTQVGYMNDYVTGLEINADNVIEVEDSVNRKIEPYPNGWMSIRANSEGPSEIKESTASFIVRDRIYKVTKLLIKGVPLKAFKSGEDDILTSHLTEWDITDHVLEQKTWNSKTDLDYTAKIDRQAGKITRGNSLPYATGSNRITGLGSKGKYNDIITNTTIPERALYEAIYSKYQQWLDDNHPGYEVVDGYNDNVENFDEVVARVEYIPLLAIRGTVYKDGSRNKPKSIKYINESAPIIDSNIIGNYANTMANKLSAGLEVLTGLVGNIAEIPTVGSVLDTGEKVISRNVEVHAKTRSFTLEVYADYVGLSNFVGIPSKHRQYEVPDTDIVFRQDKYSEYVILDRKDRISKHTIYNSWGMATLLTPLLPGLTSSSLVNPINFGVLRVRLNESAPGDANWTTFDKLIDLTVDTTALGRTSVFSTHLDDNRSAGPKNTDGVILLGSNGLPVEDPDKGTYEYTRYQQDVLYVDELGRIDSMRVEMYTDGLDLVIMGDIYADAQDYPELVEEPVGTMASQIDVKVLKDAREKLGWVQQLHFDTDDETLRTYPGLAKYNGLMCDNDEVEMGVVLLLDDYYPNTNITNLDMSRAIDVPFTDTHDLRDDVNGVRARLTYTFTPAQNATGWALYNKNTFELLFSSKEVLTSGVAHTDDLFLCFEADGYVDRDATSITIENEDISMAATQLTSQITYSLEPWYADNIVTYSVSNTTDFSVNQLGYVTAINAGTTQLIVTADNGKTDSITITAYPLATAITINPYDELVYVEWDQYGSAIYPDAQQLTYGRTPANAWNDIIFEYVDSSDAINPPTEIDEGGYIYPPTKAGWFSFKATSPLAGIDSDVGRVDIQNHIKEIILDVPPTIGVFLWAGTQEQIEYTIDPNTFVDDDVLFDYDVVSGSGLICSNSGLITATDIGVITIRAYSPLSGAESYSQVESIAPTPTAVTIEEIPDNIDIWQGIDFQMSASVTPAIADQSITWSVTNTTDFSIDQNGLLSATYRSIDTTTRVVARATADPAIYDEYQIIANRGLPTSISIGMNTDYMNYSTSRPILVTILPSEANQDYTVTFTPDDEGWVYDSINELVYSPPTASTVLITATSTNALEDSVTISASTAPFESATIDINSFSANAAGHLWMAPNSTKQLTSTPLPVGSVPPALEYELRDSLFQPTDSTITVQGLYTIAEDEEDLIKLTGPGGSTDYDSIEVTSVYDNPTALVITGLSSITVGSPSQLGVIVQPVSGNPEVVWTKDDPGNHFTLSATGVIEATSTGSCVVTATAVGGVTRTKTIYSTGGGGGCIDRNTLIPMYDGSVSRARSLKIGNIIIGYNEVTQTNVPVKVVYASSNYYTSYYLINEDLKITKEHPVYILRNDVWSWIDSSEIMIGDELLGLDGKFILVESKTYLEERIDVITLNVEDVDCYFAGKEPVLVHNIELEK